MLLTRPHLTCGHLNQTHSLFRPPKMEHHVLTIQLRALRPITLHVVLLHLRSHQPVYILAPTFNPADTLFVVVWRVGMRFFDEEEAAFGLGHYVFERWTKECEEIRVLGDWDVDSDCEDHCEVF